MGDLLRWEGFSEAEQDAIRQRLEVPAMDEGSVAHQLWLELWALYASRENEKQRMAEALRDEEIAEALESGDPERMAEALRDPEFGPYYATTGPPPSTTEDFRHPDNPKDNADKPF